MNISEKQFRQDMLERVIDYGTTEWEVYFDNLGWKTYSDGDEDEDEDQQLQEAEKDAAKYWPDCEEGGASMVEWEDVKKDILHEVPLESLPEYVWNTLNVCSDTYEIAELVGIFPGGVAHERFAVNATMNKGEYVQWASRAIRAEVFHRETGDRGRLLDI